VWVVLLHGVSGVPALVYGGVVVVARLFETVRPEKHLVVAFVALIGVVAAHPGLVVRLNHGGLGKWVVEPVSAGWHVEGVLPLGGRISVVALDRAVDQALGNFVLIKAAVCLL